MYDFAIVGLENEGGRGVFARHSVAGKLMEFLIDSYQDKNVQNWVDEGSVQKAAIQIGDSNVLLIKLATGKLHEAGEMLVKHLLDFADPRRTIVIYDEALLEIGEAQIYVDPIIEATHMGIKSLIQAFGLASFVQVGIGIGSIPKDKDLWDEFFNAELPIDLVRSISNCFPDITNNIESHIKREVNAKWPVTAKQMIEAQLPERKMNLGLAPFKVQLTQKQAKKIRMQISKLLTLILQIAKKYAAACHDDENPDTNELVNLLERGIPKEMIPLVRKTGFHSDHLSFDVQSGMLVEINSAPMPSLTVMNLHGENNVVGSKLTVEMLTRRVEQMIMRSHKKGGGQILLLNQIGGLVIGKTGWLHKVQQRLENQNWIVQTGSLGDMPNADVIWANLTWMTPDRIPDVVSDNNGRGDNRIFPSPRNFLFTSKWFLALLHDDYAREVLGISEGYANMIREFVPKTFPLSEALVKTLLETKGKWYMKPYLSSGGRGGGLLTSAKSQRKILRPAVIQEWVEPYHINSDYKYDLRIAVYSDQNHQTQFTWTARVWYGTQTLQRPLDALVYLR